MLKPAKSEPIADAMAPLFKEHTREVATETASKVSNLLIPPSIDFTDKKRIVFRHGLNTKAPHIECFGADGDDLRTWDGPKVVDANTVIYMWSKPTTGTCTATGGPSIDPPTSRRSAQLPESQNTPAIQLTCEKIVIPMNWDGKPISILALNFGNFPQGFSGFSSTQPQKWPSENEHSTPYKLWFSRGVWRLR